MSGPEYADWRCSSDRALGVAGGWIVGSGRYHWNRLHGEMAYQMEPAQTVYNAAQVLTGVTRPQATTNTWLSDPASSMPQWIALEWKEQVEFSRVELTFPTQLVLETHWENPFYVAPHVAECYELQVLENGKWRTILREKGNMEQRRIHQLDTPIKTSRIRLVVTKTHGARSAGLVEIRCYV